MHARIALLASLTALPAFALLTGANLGEDYSGKAGGLPAPCIWETQAGAAIPGVVFVQTLRPTDLPGMTCPL